MNVGRAYRLEFYNISERQVVVILTSSRLRKDICGMHSADRTHLRFIFS